ncbi:MAG: fibro-slime domain-containing protein [Fibromonadales bacterium]|nr:fibro-slime domain-containing protein [Fibromonadales bacterium]
MDIPELPPLSSGSGGGLCRQIVSAGGDGGGVVVELDVMDVIYRDFPVQYSGFEEFDIDLGLAGQCAKHEGSSINTLSNQICFSGTDYITCDMGGSELEWGEDRNGIRGFSIGPDKTIEVTKTMGDWSNKVWVTKGMVKYRLDYSQCTGEEKAGTPGSVEQAIAGRYCARPLPNNGNCYGADLQDWFTDGNHTKTIYALLSFNKNNSLYEMNAINGFFPLDEYHGSDLTYGKQSVSVWCPRVEPSYGWLADCVAWRSNGHPLATEAFVNSRSLQSKWHNYHFTMAGTGTFKYSSTNNDVFEFVSNDDLWVFIDGNLVVDLGGTHTPAPAKININAHALSEGWEDGSEHVINFFYANRQTDGSGLRIRIGLSSLSPSRFGCN